MWFLPTRNRPEAMAELIASMRVTGDVPPVAVMIDGDPKPYDDIDWPENWIIRSSPVHLEMQRAFNRLLEFYPGQKFYGTIVDHCRFISPGWSSRLEEAAGDWNIAFCEDEQRFNPKTGFPRMNAATAFGGKLIETIGYVYPDFCVHLAGDDAWEEIGFELGIVKRPKGTHVRALFFVRGEFARDDNHNRMFRGKNYVQADLDAFHHWQKSTKPALMAKLAAVIPAQCRDAPLVARETKPVTVCCVNAGNYCGRGADYVNNLFDMVRRNLAMGFIGKFVCFTDDPTGLDEGIEARALPVPGIDGWWNKLALFKPGVFETGERVWFFDLDTLITGPLDLIFKYDGDFATLRDFYHPGVVGPAVISWRVNADNCTIWQDWQAAGRPNQGLGDLWWINNLDQGRFAKRACKLQDLFPGRFVSYKVSCIPYPPKGSAVICFHGTPKPHDCGVGWVEGVWKPGGYTSAEVQTFCNVSDTDLARNIRHSGARGFRWLEEKPAHTGTALVVGGGPSLGESIEEIRARSRCGHPVFALNGAAKLLAEHDIAVDWQVMLDAKPANVGLLSPAAHRFLMASQVAPGVLDTLPTYLVTLFHAQSIPGLRELLPADRPAPVLVGGGTTVLTRAMVAIHLMGYRLQHLFGVDSSFRGDTHHAYPQAMNDLDRATEVMVGGRSFLSCPWMIAQVGEFQTVAAHLADLDSEIIVHGDGLLPAVARLMVQPAQADHRGTVAA